jgi:glyceraldehyde 3-phosphate dehydrogenase
VDGSHEDLRRARAAGQNIIPTKTGVTQVIGEILPRLRGKIDGFALRVPLPVVSLVDFNAVLADEATPTAINASFQEAAGADLAGILDHSEEPLVSQDFVDDPHSAIVDATTTMVVDGNLAHVVAWYDNEWGYSNRLIDLALHITRRDRLAENPSVAAETAAVTSGTIST